MNQATNLWNALAQVVDYPAPTLRPALVALIQACSPVLPEAATGFQQFCDELDHSGFARFEELYTEGFDFDAASSPYIGYHLFGEDPKRSHFMAGLKGRCLELGLDVGAELPDHVAAVLRLMAVVPESEEAEELLVDCLVPAVEKMRAGLEGKNNPYRGLLHAVSVVLEEEAKSASTRRDVSCRPFSLSSSPTSR
jgi:nitrate reductase assembly molybdenum cofactor insertion protein NarJ